MRRLTRIDIAHMSMLAIGVSLLLRGEPSFARSNEMPAPGVDASSPPSLSVDPALWSLAEHEHRDAVLTFDHYPSPIEVGAIAAAGLEARAYRALPMIIVRGTVSQLRNLMGLEGLRSVVLDRQLDAAPDESADVTAVAADVAKLGGSVAVVDIEGDLSVVSVLEAFDWMFQNRLKHGIQAIANSWVTSTEVSADDPIGVATRIAHDAGVAVVFAAGNGSSANPANRYCAAPGAICATEEKL
ncbi:MAG TPA: hypothetical protein VGL98_03770 [Gammaproteobacteria bacterium]